MVHLITNSQEKEKSMLEKEMQARGYRVYALKTSRGRVCAAINIREAEIPQTPEFQSLCSVVETGEPYVLAGKRIQDVPTEIELSSQIVIGSRQFCLIAGPCAIESEEQILQTALRLKDAGVSVLRGGAFKPRSSPYTFQGLGEKGLQLLRKAGDLTGLPIITEVFDSEDISIVDTYTDIVQVGARNCQNFSLLKKLGKLNKPILLKRGLMVTVEEYLLAAEYILNGGNMQVILCERGIRTFETGTRSTLDISAIPLLKAKTHLPVVVDPSHAAGTWKLVEPLALAAVAAGADGLMIEVHPNPAEALSDGKQSLRIERFEELTTRLRPLVTLLGREMPVPGR